MEWIQCQDVFDNHEVAGAESRVDATRGVCEDEGSGAQGMRQANGSHGGGYIAGFVIMNPSLEDE